MSWLTAGTMFAQIPRLPGLLAPGGTPRAIVERLNTEVVRILRLTDVQERLQKEAFDLPSETPDEFAAVIKAELEKWAKVVKEIGLRPQ